MWFSESCVRYWNVALVSSQNCLFYQKMFLNFTIKIYSWKATILFPHNIPFNLNFQKDSMQWLIILFVSWFGICTIWVMSSSLLTTMRESNKLFFRNIDCIQERCESISIFMVMHGIAWYRGGINCRDGSPRKFFIFWAHSAKMTFLRQKVPCFKVSQQNCPKFWIYCNACWHTLMHHCNFCKPTIICGSNKVTNPIYLDGDFLSFIDKFDQHGTGAV